MQLCGQKTKPISILFWQRIKDREWRLSVLFLLSLLVALTCEFGSVAWFQNHLYSIITSLSYGKDFFLAFSIGLMTGIIVYFVSVVYSEVKRSLPMSIEIEQTFRRIEDSFLEFGLDLGLGEWKKADEFADSFIDRLQEGRRRTSESHLSLSLFKNVIKTLSDSLDINTLHILSYTPILTTDEIESLMNLRHSKIAQRLACDIEIAKPMTKDEIRLFAKDLVTLHNDYEGLRNQVKGRIFKNEIQPSLNKTTMKQKIFFFALLLLGCVLSMNAIAATYVTIGNLRYQLNGTEAYGCGYTGSPADVVIPEAIESDGLTFRVTKVLASAFSGCTSITSLTSETAYVIEYKAFYGCTNLTEVNIKCTTIDYSTFQGCTNLQKATLDVISIMHEAFSGCSKMEKLYLGNRLVRIDYYAFQNC